MNCSCRNTHTQHYIFCCCCLEFVTYEAERIVWSIGGVVELITQQEGFL